MQQTEYAVSLGCAIFQQRNSPGQRTAVAADDSFSKISGACKSLLLTCFFKNSTTSIVEVPGVNASVTPAAFRPWNVFVQITPPPNTRISSAPFSQNNSTTREKVIMCPERQDKPKHRHLPEGRHRQFARGLTQRYKLLPYQRHARLAQPWLRDHARPDQVLRLRQLWQIKSSSV